MRGHLCPRLGISTIVRETEDSKRFSLSTGLHYYDVFLNSLYAARIMAGAPKDSFRIPILPSTRRGTEPNAISTRRSQFSVYASTDDDRWGDNLDGGFLFNPTVKAQSTVSARCALTDVPVYFDFPELRHR